MRRMVSQKQIDTIEDKLSFVNGFEDDNGKHFEVTADEVNLKSVLGDYYDLVEYVTISDYIASPDLIVVSESVLQDLSEEDRELLKKCARDTYFYEKEQVQSFQEEYLFRIGIKKKLFLETEDFSEQLQEVLKNTK